MSSLLTFTCFDAFGLGAILAWKITYASKDLKKFYLAVSIFSAIAAFLFILGAIQQQWTFVPFRTIVSFIALWIILYIIIHRESNSLAFKLVLNNGVLIFLGRISYGLYLYHNMIPGTLNSKIVDVYLNPLLPDVVYKKYWGQLYLLENIVLLLIVSWLSYILIEKRFLNLKKYFRYED